MKLTFKKGTEVYFVEDAIKDSIYDILSKHENAQGELKHKIVVTLKSRKKIL